MVVGRELTGWREAPERSSRALEVVAEQRGQLQAARSAQRRKEECLALLSHELRNPLAAIR